MRVECPLVPLLRASRTIRLLADRYMQRDYLVVALTARMVQRAQDRLEQQPLRAYDALQLASALASNVLLVSSGRSAMIFTSADARVLAAAATPGLTAGNPNAHP